MSAGLTMQQIGWAEQLQDKGSYTDLSGNDYEIVKREHGRYLAMTPEQRFDDFLGDIGGVVRRGGEIHLDNDISKILHGEIVRLKEIERSGVVRQ